jgi:outer membrane protein assembly factor BamA
VSPLDPAVTDFSYNIGRTNISLSRDTRDDILNATRGTFFSNSFEIAPPRLGSTFPYVKISRNTFASVR